MKLMYDRRTDTLAMLLKEDVAVAEARRVDFQTTG